MNLKKLWAVAMLLIGVTASAQSRADLPELSSTENPTYYYLRNVRRNGSYATYQGESQVMTQLGASETPSYKNMFYFVSAGQASNGYVPVKIYSAVSEGKSMASFNSWTIEGSTWYLYSNPNGNGNIAICKVANISDTNCFNDYGGTTINAWQAAGDSGSEWYVEKLDIQPEFVTATFNFYYQGSLVYTSKTKTAKGDFIPTPSAPAYVTCNMPVGNIYEDTTYDVEAIVNTPFKSSTSFEDATWYQMAIRPSIGTRYASTEQNNGSCALYRKNSRNDKYLWAFIGDPFNGYKIINRGSGEGLYLNVVPGNDNKPYMSENPMIWTLGYGTDKAAGFGVQGSWMNNYGGDSNEYIGQWQDGPAADEGSSFVFTEVDPNCKYQFDFDPTPANEDQNSALSLLSEFHITVDGAYSVATDEGAEGLITDQFQNELANCSLSTSGNVVTVKLDQAITTQTLAVFTLSLEGLIIDDEYYKPLIYAIYYVSPVTNGDNNTKETKINEIMASNKTVDVFTADGKLVKKGATANDLRELKGLFVIKGSKFMMK